MGAPAHRDNRILGASFSACAAHAPAPW
jgi:hypothetical protein